MVFKIIYHIHDKSYKDLYSKKEIAIDLFKNFINKEFTNNSNINITAVIPIVLYNGEQVWDVPSEFRKMFYNEEMFHNGVLNFTYDVFDVNNGFTKEELINSKNVTAAIFLLDQKITPQEFLEIVKAITLFFDGLTIEEVKKLREES